MEAKLQTLFATCEKHPNGKALLSSVNKEIFWRLGLHLSTEVLKQLSSMFGVDRSQLDFEEFKELVVFLLQVFKSWKSVDTSNTLVLKRAQIRQLVSNFTSSKLGEGATQFDLLFDGTDAMEEVRFDDFVSLMLYVHGIDMHFKLPPNARNNSNLLDAADIQAILRVIGVQLTTNEVSLVLKLRQSHLDIPNMTVVQFMELLAATKSNKEKIREASKKLRAVQRLENPGAAIQKKHSVLLRNLRLLSSDTVHKLRELSASDPTLRTALQQAHASPTGKWEDPEFPATSASLFPNDPTRCAAVSGWKRLNEISTNPSLFAESSDEGDVVQGALGNSWFLSALTMLASTGYEGLQSLFAAKYPNEGIYQCAFYKDGEWRLVTIDDRLPVNNAGLPCFARCRNPDEFWASLLEKAYAKLHGCYAHIELGSTADALVDLVGEAAEDITISRTDELWQKLLRNYREGLLMGAAFIEHNTPPRAHTPFGVIKNYVYTILYVEEYNGHRLIRLRDPWGEMEWTGRWSDGSKEWTPELMAHFNSDTINEGNFFMTFEDFCVHFNQLFVLWLTNGRWHKFQFKSAWNVETAGGCLNFDTWHKNPQYKLVTSAEDNIVFVSIRHMDGRLIKPKPNFNYASFGIFVMKLDRPDENFKKMKALNSDLVCTSTYKNTRENSIEFNPVVGDGYIVVPSTFEPDTRVPFILTIYTRYKCELVELNSKRPSQSVKGAWGAGIKTNGGSIECPSWRYSPQYLLRVQKEGKLRLSLSQQVIDPLPPIGFTIFRAEPEFRRKLHLKDFVLVPREYIATAVVAGEITLQEGEYFVMVACDKPKYSNTYTLEIESATAQFTIEEPAPYHIISLSGEWSRHECGGCKNHPTWPQNPYILLRMESKQTITCVLRYKETLKDVTLGFYVFAANSNYTLGQQLTKSKFTPVSSAETFRLDRGEYIIVPTTFTPNVLREFVIDIFCDTPDIQLSRLQSKIEHL